MTVIIENFSFIRFYMMRRMILDDPRSILLMDPELIVKLKTAYLELRNTMLIRGGTMCEADVLCEMRLTEHLGVLARIWTKQAEKFHDDNYPSGDDPPKTSDGGEGGPVPQQ